MPKKFIYIHVFKGAKVGTYCIIYKPMVIEYVECISYYLVKKTVELTMEYNLYFDIPYIAILEFRLNTLRHLMKKRRRATILQDLTMRN